MEKIIQIKNEYNSLDALYTFLKRESPFECSKDYDVWDLRTDANGQMEQCIVIKKSGMHAVKLFFTEENTIKVNHIIPSKLMHAYFGKSVKVHRNILEIGAGYIKQGFLVGAQKKAFAELEETIQRAAF